MSKNVLLITGASSGFGYGVAEEMLKHDNYVVYVAARRMEKMQPLVDLGAYALKMDVTNSEEVNSCIETIIQEQGQINALLSNAGYGSYGTIEDVTVDEIQYQYNVNVFGMARVIQAVLPHMRKQRSGRIVMTNSMVSHMSMAGLGWYASTKHALYAVGTALRQEVSDLGIEVVMIEPGVVKTGFDSIALGTMRGLNVSEDYREKMQGFDQYITKSYKVGPGPESTIRDMVNALTSKNPKSVYKTTSDSKMLPAVMNLIPDKMLDSMIGLMMKPSK